MARERKPQKRPLSMMQKAFAREYALDFNATQAAIRAGYSVRSAYAQSHELLKKPEIRAEVEKELQAAVDRTHITKDRIMLELARLAFSNVGEFVKVSGGKVHLDLARLTPSQTAAIQSIDVEGEETEDGIRVGNAKVRLADKAKALEMLGKHIGMWPGRIELTGAGGGPVEFRDVTGIPTASLMEIALGTNGPD